MRLGTASAPMCGTVRALIHTEDTRCLLYTSLVFGFAEEQELITKNPMDKVECPKLQKKKVDALTQEQAQQFFSLLPSVPLDFRCMLYLFITTGLRRGELLGLQWGDIDFDNLTIEIKRNVTYTKRNGIVEMCIRDRVNKVRLLSIMYSGLMAGLGGAFLSMGQLSFFVEGMVSGRGFMALAAVVFGNYSPKGILGAALLFGAADAIQLCIRDR